MPECKPENRSARGPGGRPAPLLRSRTLPAIVAPGLSILQAQIEARYGKYYKKKSFYSFFSRMSYIFRYEYNHYRRLDPFLIMFPLPLQQSLPAASLLCV